jgi:hypothetical protein
VDNISRGGVALRGHWPVLAGEETAVAVLHDLAPLRGRVVRRNDDLVALAFLQSPENLRLVDHVLSTLPNEDAVAA